MSASRKESPNRSRWWDCAFLGVVTAISSLLSISHLGFYSDDWAFLASFRFAPIQTWWGFLMTYNKENGTLARPVQGIYDLLLYRLFGLRPFGYHAAIVLVLFVSLCLFYLALQELWGSRLLALAVALVYGLLPQYSTVRLWFATTQITISMCCYFLALYADARHDRSQRGWTWVLLSCFSLVTAGLAYEAFLPLFLVNPILVALKRFEWKQRWFFYLKNPPLIGLVLYYKVLTTPNRAHLRGFTISNAVHAAVDLIFGAYGARLPHVTAAIWQHYWDLSAVVVALVIATVVAVYLGWTATKPSTRIPGTPAFAVMLAVGFVLAGLSYAYFWGGFGFVPGVNIGINNRVASAASIPVAFAIIGLLGLLSRMVPGTGATLLFVVLIALVCGWSYWIDQTIASFWIEASRQQSVILREVTAAVPNPPKGTSIVLNGYCPWIGPGIIFETDWDTTGILDLTYNDRSLKGDVLRPQMTVTENALMNMYNQPVYSFTSLYIYDVGSKQAVRITDREGALRYMKRSSEDPQNSCLTDDRFDGVGTPVW